MRYLKTIFGQQILFKWDDCLLRIKMLNIYFMSYIFSLNMRWLNLEKLKKVNQF